MEKVLTVHARVLENVPPHLCVCVTAALSLFSPLNQLLPLLLHIVSLFSLK